MRHLSPSLRRIIDSALQQLNEHDPAEDTAGRWSAPWNYVSSKIESTNDRPDVKSTLFDRKSNSRSGRDLTEVNGVSTTCEHFHSHPISQRQEKTISLIESR